jgi:hypothetical protein
MKKLSLKLGITAVAAAFVLAAFTTPNANANKYWRFAPGGLQVSADDCITPSTDVCANIYNDAGTQLVGTVHAVYDPE